VNASAYLKATLLLRVRNHTDNTICHVVDWMLKSNLFNENIIPSCIRCIAHTLRNADKNEQVYHHIYRVLREHSQRNIVTQALTLITKNNKEHYNNCLYLAYAMLESQNNIVKNSLFSILMSAPFQSEIMQEFSTELYKHPFLFIWTDPSRIKYLKNLLRERVYIWKEEFVAKAWHPSRFLEWCVDPVEAAEWGYPDPDVPRVPLTSKRAEWDIAW
jgi:hypothetical protein